MKKYEITSWNYQNGWMAINYIDENGNHDEWITDLSEDWANHMDADDDMNYIEVTGEDDEWWQVIWTKKGEF